MIDTIPPIEVHDLTVTYQSNPVLWAVDFTIPQGTCVAIVGPNGAGKSTLLKAIMGLLPLSSGYVKVFGEASVQKKRSLLAYVPQRGSVDWDFPISVLDVVLMGRYGRLPFYKKLRPLDYDAAMDALREVGMEDLASRQIGQLSGGQQQRVFIARALVQQAQIYLLDEPFAGIDAATEQAIISLFEKLKSSGKTVITVHHDLHTVLEYFDWGVLLNLRLISAGPIESVMTPENLTKAYGGRLGLLTEVTEKLRTSGWKQRS